MDVYVAILLESTAILTVISGLAGFVLSLLLLLSPQSVHRISAGLNRQVDMDMALARLNFPLRIDPLIYRYPFVFGVFFSAGSLFCLLFLQFGIKISFLASIFSAIIVDFLLLLGKVAGVLGLVVGLMLIVAPRKLFLVQNAVDFWVDTDKVLKRLDNTAIDIDAVCLRHPVIFGVIGTLASIILLVLAVVNLLYRFAS